MVSSRLLRRVALVRTDVSEEPGASFIRVTKIGELGTTQAAALRSIMQLVYVAISNINKMKVIQKEINQINYVRNIKHINSHSVGQQNLKRRA
jgi:hypothetical protein